MPWYIVTKTRSHCERALQHAPDPDFRVSPRLANYRSPSGELCINPLASHQPQPACNLRRKRNRKKKTPQWTVLSRSLSPLSRGLELFLGKQDGKPDAALGIALVWTFWSRELGRAAFCTLICRALRGFRFKVWNC